MCPNWYNVTVLLLGTGMALKLVLEKRKGAEAGA
jgi:hypothetical protein